MNNGSDSAPSFLNTGSTPNSGTTNGSGTAPNFDEMQIINVTSATIEGHVAADPEVRTIPGTAVRQFEVTVLVNKDTRKQNEDGTSTVVKKVERYVLQHPLSTQFDLNRMKGLVKGRHVLVQGRLTHRSYPIVDANGQVAMACTQVDGVWTPVLTTQGSNTIEATRTINQITHIAELRFLSPIPGTQQNQQGSTRADARAAVAAEIEALVGAQEANKTAEPVVTEEEDLPY